MKTIDKWAERVYAETDFGRSIATSISGAIGLTIYITMNDWVVAAFCSIIVFPLIRIMSTGLHQKVKTTLIRKAAENESKNIIKNLSHEERNVIQAFVDAGGTSLTFSQINRLPLSSSAIESLIQRGLLWTSMTADAMTETFALDICLFDSFRNNAL